MDPDSLDRAFPDYGPLWQHIRGGVGFGSAAAASPEFTCPSCRTVVNTKPVQCYKLKKLTIAIGDVTGEGEPAAVAWKGKQKASPVWDEFFG